MSDDRSHGWNDVVDDFARNRSSAGTQIVRDWALSLPQGARVLDAGAGTGEPNLPILLDAGLDVFALDAAPAMVAELEKRFPGVPVLCAPAEDSDLFGQRFGGILAIGLVFLLGEEGQAKLIGNLARALAPGGSLLVSAPWQEGSWKDLQTGRMSVSLGREGYRAHLTAAGLAGIEEREDPSGIHHYVAWAAG